MNILHKEKILSKLFENLNFSNKKGMIIASPSENPPYKFHWIRDSALVMRVIINEFRETKDNLYFVHIINYIENECHIQNLETLTGLGEPKYNIDGTAYNEPWGRPQNDGPALRCINLIETYKLLSNHYPLISKMIIGMIEKDLKYIIQNKDSICFDLWEEIEGWHFYTRLVQLKCIKDYISNIKYFENYFQIDNITEIYNDFLENIKDHLTESRGYISSFDSDGNIIRENDASILLAFCHISFDKEIIKELPVAKTIFNIEELLNCFREKNNTDINLIGRYSDDIYYGGQIWIICSLALAQIYGFLKYLNYKKNIEKIYNFIISIDENFNLAEQFDSINMNQLSAKKLTWNYSELYFTNIMNINE